MGKEVKPEKTENGKKEEKNSSKQGSKTDTSELPFKRKKVQKRFKNEVDIRRRQLMGVVKKIGLKNAMKGVKTWAEHYKVSERMIYKDFKWIRGNYKPSAVEEMRIELDISRDNSIQAALKQLDDAMSFEQRDMALKTLLNASKRVREELEAWGLKEKVPDEVKHSGKVLLLKWKDHDDSGNGNGDPKKPKAKNSMGTSSRQKTH